VSVIDELKGLEDRVAQRMLELRPLVDEYRELEQVAQRLGVSPAASADTPAPARRRSQRRARTNPRATRPASRTAGAARAPSKTADAASRARANGRREQLLDMVKARPGITVREAGTELGVDPTSLYRIVHRLERDGALRKRGRELLPR
jgi:transcriptional regulator with GAF, ATPase, and Fis domain